MTEPVNWTALIVMFLVYAALTIGLLALLRVFWMWLFGAAAIVQELEALRSEVRDLRKALAPPAETTSRSATPTHSASSGRVGNTGWGDDDAARSMRYVD